MRLAALLSVTSVMLAAPPASADSGAPAGKQKTSLEAIGVTGRDTLRNIGQGYGLEICGNGFIKEKEEIKTKAWARLQQKCSRFTMQVMDNYEDDPNKLFSLCVGGSLLGCQKAIELAEPCEDLASCQALLGVP